MLLTHSVDEQCEEDPDEVQKANAPTVGDHLLEHTGPSYRYNMNGGAPLAYPNETDEDTYSYYRYNMSDQPVTYPNQIDGDTYSCYQRGPLDRGAPEVGPMETDMYGFPIGMAGTFVPETLIYPDDERQKLGKKSKKQGKASSGSDSHSGSGSESDSQSGRKHKKHRKKKKSKHRRDKKEKTIEKTSQTVSPYAYYSDGSQVVIVPEQAITYRHGPSGISEEAFERHMPPPPHQMDHCVAEDYDPAWHYNLKEYIRGQQHVKGCTEPVIRETWPAYESHIDEFPPVDYYMDDPYDDNGPYEHHLPAAGGRAAARDPTMINSNFIIRKRDDYRRNL